MGHRYSGVALITALVLLVVITLLSLAAIRSGTQELRMAANHEARTNAFQTAVAIIDAVIESPSSIVVAGAAGSESCTTNETGCAGTPIALPDVAPFSDPLVEGHVRVLMEDPDSAPPRSMDTSVDKFGVATFSISARSDTLSDSTDRLVRGRAQVSQGFMVLVPKNSQTN